MALKFESLDDFRYGSDPKTELQGTTSTLTQIFDKCRYTHPIVKQENQTTCPACTLLCDDIIVGSDGSIDARGCEKGAEFFQIESTPKLTHYVAGKPAKLDDAVAAAVGILNQAKAPLVCGLDHLTTQAQQIAWKIGDRIGATVDTTISNYGRSSLFSLQRVGKVTASIGEIAQRSDVILFWCCDPAKTHPRLLERLNRGNVKRKIILVGEPGNSTVAHADQFFEIAPNQASDALAFVRASLMDGNVAAQSESSDSAHDSCSEQCVDLAEQLVSAKYGAVFYGQTAEDSAFDLAGESLAALVRSLNQSTRFVGMKLRTDSNAISAENVLSWSSGYAMAVNHATGSPRSNWLEYSCETVLNRQECDAVLMATGADLSTALGGLSRTAQEYLSSIPRVLLSPIENLAAEVSIAVGVNGIDESGEFCRNDDVSMPLVSLPSGLGSTDSGSTDSAAVIALRAMLEHF